MKFKFLYVDDEINDIQRIREAVQEHNKENNLVELIMLGVENVERLREQLAPDVDLVLADVNFKIGDQEVSRLREIIEAVATWSAANRQAPIPIVSFTGFGKKTLEPSLKEKLHLLDIWDKDSTSQEYVTWRLSKIAMEISRLRPDTFLLRLVQEMPKGAAWHDLVKAMPFSYNFGLTEKDQIEGVSADIEKIGKRMGVSEQVKDMWSAMTTWENLSRAVSATVRGHARHVVNVFWMGYYLIHHPILAPRFEESWSALLSRRAEELAKVQDGDRTTRDSERLKSLRKILSDNRPGESLSDAWYFAALFHDVGSCVPKYRELRRISDGLVSAFGYGTQPLPKPEAWIPEDVVVDAERLFAEMPSRMREHFAPMWDKSLQNGTPDHGVVGALRIRQRFHTMPQIAAAYEAARAVCGHNLIGDLGKGETDVVAWEDEPLCCLLILCDQIQTWDRERGDEGIYGPDFPSRAQLTALDIQSIDGKLPTVQMDIQYIVPSYIEHSYVLYLRMKQRLETVLREKPDRALARIANDWPFQLRVNCSLGGVELLEPITKGELNI